MLIDGKYVTNYRKVYGLSLLDESWAIASYEEKMEGVQDEVHDMKQRENCFQLLTSFNNLQVKMKMSC